MTPHKRSKVPDDNLDPDVRFLLANERTLLAWIRTSLAVLAGGIALTQLGHDSTTKTVIGIVAILLGVFMAAVGYQRFRVADKSIRVGKLPPTGFDPIVQVSGIVVIAAGLAITHLVGVW